MKPIRMWRALFGIIAAAGAATGTPAWGQTATMKMASATIGDVQHEWLKRFESEMKTRAGERVKVEIYPASQLGAIPRMVEGVLLGTIEAFVTPTSFLVGTEARYQAFDAIGVFQSPEHLGRVLGDADFRKQALAIGDAKGVKGIGIFYNSPVVVVSKKTNPDVGRLQGPEDSRVRHPPADRTHEGARRLAGADGPQ